MPISLSLYVYIAHSHTQVLHHHRCCLFFRTDDLVPQHLVSERTAVEATSYEEASVSPASATWHLAMESEMHSIRANKTWDLVELPKNRRALPCKWVYRLKETSDSTNSKYKEGLVAKGFRQEYGVDFNEIFLLVVKMTTL